MSEPSLGGKITTPSAGSRAPTELSSLGGGWLWIASAKLLFIFTSYATQLALPRLLGSVSEFGRLATALNLAAIVNNVLVVASIQAVSRFVGNGDAQVELRRGLQLQGAVGLCLAALAWSVSPWLASRVLLDGSLLPLLRIACLLVLAYALYGTAVGFLNGQQQFVRQARNDMAFSLLRLLCIVGAAALGFGAAGAMGGFAMACVLITVALLLRVGVGRESTEPFPWQRWLAFMAPLWLYQICLNGLQQIDLALLKRGAANLSLAAGVEASAAAAYASHLAGLYRAAQLFAFVPYQLALSLTWVMFPAFAHATAAAQTQRIRQLVRTALRVTWLLVGLSAAPIAGAAAGILRLAFPPDYQLAAPALRLLVFGLGAFSCFVVAATLLASGGRPLLAALIAAGALLLALPLLHVALYATYLPGELLERVAAATSLACLAALLAALLALHWLHRAGLPWRSFLRGSIAALLSFLLAANLPSHTNGQALGALAAGGAAYLVTLGLLGEVGGQEWQRLRRALKS